MTKIAKTNAARLLDRAAVPYELIPYTVDPDDLSATHLAAELGEDVRRVFKTLVLQGDDRSHFVAVVPGDTEVDLKKAARAAGVKKADLIPMKELLPLTGYIRGGCTSIGMKKQFPTVVEQSLREKPFIYVSGGKRGLQLKLAPGDLVQAAGAMWGDVLAKD